jgi:hydroxymethylglutaryl-CoA lyase
MADTPVLLPTLPPASTMSHLPLPRSQRSESPFSGTITTRTEADAHAATQPLLPEEAGVVHYPVLVPNMRGLDNLLKLEEEWKSKGGKERLTDEIAVFVAATEVGAT